jgi:hypothetical protein
MLTSELWATEPGERCTAVPSGSCAWHRVAEAAAIRRSERVFMGGVFCASKPYSHEATPLIQMNKL